MNEYIYKISSIYKKIGENKKRSFIMKGIALFLVSTISFTSSEPPDTMNVARCILFLIIWIIFFLDVYFVKQNKKLEYKIYELEKEELESESKLVEFISEGLLDAVSNKKIVEPSKEISLPIIYYFIMTAIVIIGVIMLSK